MIKNPVLGRVKTRLARDLGDEMALKVYRKLVDNTLHRVKIIPADKRILFSDFREVKIIPDGLRASTGMQKGQELGKRMYHAFMDGFRADYQHICLIGGDCYDISAPIINEAFDRLRSYDFVLGPSNDGGYYLIGMNNLLESIFLNKKWGTSEVLKNTISDIEKDSSTWFLLKELIDVDTIEDFELLNINPEIFIHHEP